jgi:hypothetical protein
LKGGKGGFVKKKQWGFSISFMLYLFSFRVFSLVCNWLAVFFLMGVCIKYMIFIKVVLVSGSGEGGEGFFSDLLMCGSGGVVVVVVVVVVIYDTLKIHF